MVTYDKRMTGEDMRGTTVAKKKRVNPSRDLVQIRAPRDWIDRATAEAARLGLSLSAYIRLAVSERMDRTGAGQERPGGGGRGADR